MKRILPVLFYLILIPAMSFSQISEKSMGAGLHLGFGLPKAPYKYRTPISLTGGIRIQKKLSPRIILQANANKLITFDLGTVNKTDGDLEFDLLWGNVYGLYRVGGKFTGHSYAGVGVGRYRVHQKYDNDVTDLDSWGISLGISSYRLFGRTNSLFDMRWHLIFEPEPQPQLLTITFGFLL